LYKKYFTTLLMVKGVSLSKTSSINLSIEIIEIKIAHFCMMIQGCFCEGLSNWEITGDFMCSSSESQVFSLNLNSALDGFNCDNGDSVPMQAGFPIRVRLGSVFAELLDLDPNFLNMDPDERVQKRL